MVRCGKGAMNGMDGMEAMEARKGMDAMKGDLMSRAEAIGILARMATGVALQLGVRQLSRRLFEQARWHARKRDRKAGTTGTDGTAGDAAGLEEPWMGGEVSA